MDNAIILAGNYATENRVHCHVLNASVAATLVPAIVVNLVRPSQLVRPV